MLVLKESSVNASKSIGIIKWWNMQNIKNKKGQHFLSLKYRSNNVSEWLSAHVNWTQLRLKIDK